MKKKLYLVSREVLASNIREAINKKGVVYSVTIAEDKYQPENSEKKDKIGFIKK